MLIGRVLVPLLLLLCSANAFEWPWEDSSSSSESVSASATASSSSSSSSDSSSGPLGFLFGSADATKNPYAPKQTACPSGSILREAKGLLDSEKEYLGARSNVTNTNLIDFLSKRAKLLDFDASKFINGNAKSHNITIGLSFSGGGYRAMLCGAGQMLGLDSRYDDANNHGLGGLLQSSTYLVGLSGGNWLVGSLVLNDWLSVGDILDGNEDIWNLNDSIFNPNGLNVLKTVSYYTGIGDDILAKDEAGFATSVTDVWGRALSNQFFTLKSGGDNITWSGITDLPSFQNHELPYPIVVANGRTPGTTIINQNSTVFEISPYELGSWDSSLKSFVQTKYLGSYVDNGKNSSGECYNNYDNAGFIMGTSSSLFNQAILRIASGDLISPVKTVLTSILSPFSDLDTDIAVYQPNPFHGSDFGNSENITTDETLFLCDGGEDQQNVPFYPLIQNDRNVDVIFGFDNSADTKKNWPNGKSAVFTYQRQFSEQGKGTPFPYIPSVQEFADQNLTQGPVFFGCDSSKLKPLIEFHDNSNINETDIPLVVYIPNYYVSFEANTSTFKMSYDTEERDGLIENGFGVLTLANLTDDQDWAKCVGCAIIRRQQERLGEKQSNECLQCFEKYCWTGSEAQAAATLFGSSGIYSATSPGFGNSGTSTSKSGSSGGSNSASSSSSKSKKGDGSTVHPSYLVSVITVVLSAVLGVL